jgi:hypothetical protein
MPTLTRHRRRRLAGPLALLMLLICLAALTATHDAAWAAPTPNPTPIVSPQPSTSPPVPSPTPTAVTPSLAPTVPDSSGDNPGLFDIPGQIRKAISDFISWVARTGLRPVLDTLGQTVLATPGLIGNPQVQAIWTTCLVAANAVFVLFVIAGGFIVASRETLQSRYGLKEILPRVVVAGVLANTSLLLCGKAIELANALTVAIAGQGVDGLSAATAIEQILDVGIAGSVLYSLLVLTALVMAIVVLITFIVRTALVVLLIGVAPLALTCHATPQTEGLAYTWWRAFAACLGMQLGQALIVLVTVRVFLTPAGPQVLGVPSTTNGLLGLLVCLTMLWLLIKLPSWTRHLALGGLGGGRGLVGQIINAVLMVKTLGTLTGIGRMSRPRISTGSSTGTGMGTAVAKRPVPTRPGARATAPRSGRTSSSVGVARRRTRPSPPAVGPAAFSHAPITHTPTPPPTGSAGSPVFSQAPQPSAPRPSPAAAAVAPRFSHQPAAPAGAPAAVGLPPSAVRFSNPPGTHTPRQRAAGPVPAAGFSAASRSQVSPSRPPAPATPVFSSPSPSPSPSSLSRPDRPDRGGPRPIKGVTGDAAPRH